MVSWADTRLLTDFAMLPPNLEDYLDEALLVSGVVNESASDTPDPISLLYFLMKIKLT